MKTEICKENNIINRIILKFMTFRISKHIRKCKVKPQTRHNYLKFILQQIFWILNIYAAAVVKSLQSCPTLCNPITGSPPGSSVPGILQARILNWVAVSFSNAWKWKVKVKSLSRAWLLATPWTAAHQAPSSMGFSRQEYWSGLPSPPPNI